MANLPATAALQFVHHIYLADNEREHTDTIQTPTKPKTCSTKGCSMPRAVSYSSSCALHREREYCVGGGECGKADEVCEKGVPRYYCMYVVGKSSAWFLISLTRVMCGRLTTYLPTYLHMHFAESTYLVANAHCFSFSRTADAHMKDEMAALA